MLCDGLCYQSSFIDDTLIASTQVSKKEKPLIAQFKPGGLDRGEFCIVFELVWERKWAFHCQPCVVFIPQQFREVRLNPFFLVCYSLNKIPSSRQIMKSVLMHEAFWGRWLGSWKADRFLFFLFSLHAFSQHRENIKQNKAIIARDELQRNKGDVTVVRECVVSGCLFSTLQFTARGGEGWRLLASTFSCACELRSLCLDYGFPSVSSYKYLRHTGSWPRSSPGSGFCGLAEFAVFIVWAVQRVCGKGRDQACLLAAAVSFLFCFSFQLYLYFNLCVHLITHFAALLKYFLYIFHHPL